MECYIVLHNYIMNHHKNFLLYYFLQQRVKYSSKVFRYCFNNFNTRDVHVCQFATLC